MAHKDLKSSRWANRNTSQPRILSRAEYTAQEIQKAARLFKRLQWKAESLVFSYNRAMDVLHELREYPIVHSLNRVSASGALLTPEARERETEMQKKQAESMFKLDFFEFYVLLERYITLCLSILGVHVSSSASLGPNVNALRSITNPGGPPRSITIPDSNSSLNAMGNGGDYMAASHQFHANLLATLDQESCPLHKALGTQDVRIQLGLAKDYRNRWKDADEKLFGSKWAYEDGEARKGRVKLEDLELKKMLTTILTGLEDALVVVLGHENANNSNGNGVIKSDSGVFIGYEDEMEMDVDESLAFMNDDIDMEID
ncbi:hypothetical protein K469DRAFT_545165 [Zopfia rhizophila CBS 207.26]|uniref:Uncharacterized protein n=1 Tax=Zopfia rhizophila CBS 207.26 TaxID=1314779 RepID=A0A6A6EY11_9PEZI|nr:hypothetical protein K469DRAFT_545165 [Zopfia rhizophila CBS 207.26]